MRPAAMWRASVRRAAGFMPLWAPAPVPIVRRQLAPPAPIAVRADPLGELSQQIQLIKQLELAQLDQAELPPPAPIAKPIAARAPDPARVPVAERVDLRQLESALDQRARAAAAAAVAAGTVTIAALGADGKLFCKLCDARVPSWFATDCIAGKCSLRSMAA